MNFCTRRLSLLRRGNGMCPTKPWVIISRLSVYVTILRVLNFNLLHLRALQLRCFSSGDAADGTMNEDDVWLVELFARRRGATPMLPCFVGNSCWIPFLQKSHESTSVFPDALFQASHQSRRWVPKRRRQPSRLLQDADVSINPCIPRDRTRLEAGLSSSPLSSLSSAISSSLHPPAGRPSSWPNCFLLNYCLGLRFRH